jgi:hypothetical protein
MTPRHVLRSLPGHLAVAIASLIGAFLGFVQLMSFFYEGWGQPLAVALPYFALPVAVVIFFLIAVRWPGAGGSSLAVAGLAAIGWWLRGQSARWGLSADTFLQALFMLVPLIAVAAFFLLEARHRRALATEGTTPPARWWAKNYRYVLVVGIPLVAILIATAMQLPERLARRDDGQRGARTIEGNGVTLVWAPQGPGWNWRQPEGDFPSWNMLAAYGAAPVGLKRQRERAAADARRDDMARTGLCGYLNEDGSALLFASVQIWRLPTADEVIRSLTRNGTHAGCTWDGRSHEAVCAVPPDKETPLWAPDQAPIYYWTADAPDESNAIGINYTGGIGYHPKFSDGVGFRCVKPAR